MRTLMAAALTLTVSSSALSEPFYVGAWSQNVECTGHDIAFTERSVIFNEIATCQLTDVAVDGSEAVVQGVCLDDDEDGRQISLFIEATGDAIRFTPAGQVRSETYYRCDAPRALSRDIEEREH